MCYFVFATITVPCEKSKIVSFVYSYLEDIDLENLNFQ